MLLLKKNAAKTASFCFFHFQNLALLAANFFALPVEKMTNLPLALITVEIPE
jgi:hypothetical protein